MLNNPLTESTFTSAVNQVDLLWLGFYIAAIIFIIHALIVGYHWFTYGTDKKTPVLAMSIYAAVGAGILLGIASLISFI